MLALETAGSRILEKHLNKIEGKIHLTCLVRVRVCVCVCVYTSQRKLAGTQNANPPARAHTSTHAFATAAHSQKILSLFTLLVVAAGIDVRVSASGS